MVCVPIPGEEVCGDGWAVEQDREFATVMVVDGLGHGPFAQECAVAAAAAFAQANRGAPLEVVEAISRRETRFAGIGNIAGVVHHENRSRHMVSYAGIAGHDLRNVRELTYPWEPGAVVLLYSDGIATRWSLEQYEGLLAKDPSLLARCDLPRLESRPGRCYRPGDPRKGHGMTAPLYTLEIHSEEDVVAARSRARELAGLLGFDNNDQTRIATALSEIVRNAYHYAGGGRVEFALDAGEGLYSIAVSDAGPGIAELKSVLAGTYKSRTGMGLGILGARRLVDAFSLESEPGRGTVVRLGKRLPAKSQRMTPQRLAKISGEVSKGTGATDVLRELREENRELLRLMDELGTPQNELTQLNAELEDTNRGVVALYAELDEKAERLRRADEMKSRFLSHMSHEFRTPLASIMALSRLLADESDGKLSPEQQKQVSFIRRSAESLLEMVNDLLDLARVEAGKSVVRPTSFSVASLFGALRGVLRPLQINAGVELVFEDASGLPMMYTDEAKVAQILRNFVSNALKFTESGEVRVSARLNGDGTAVVFSVSDTGIGIAQEHLEVIFQEFAQIETPIQRKWKGAGLGLALSKGLAEFMGGRVAVKSELGRGSTFSAEIPLLYAGTDTEAASPQPGCDVLLIEDEEVSRYLVRQSLGSSTQMAEAVDGREGLSLAKRLRPRAIILDLRMSGMSGFEVLRELKADPHTRAIPVLVLTSIAVTAQDRAILDQNAVAVFSKEVLSMPDAGVRLRTALAAGARGTVETVAPSPS